MEWLKRNYKTIVGALIILIALEAVLVWYMIQRFHENYLSRDEAVSVALADAGLEREHAGEAKIRLNSSKGEAWYEIEFPAADGSGSTYHYLIHAETGEILLQRP